MSGNHSFEEAVLRAVLAERERIAQELLAGTVHTLFRIGIELEAIAASSAEPKVAERLHGSMASLIR